MHLSSLACTAIRRGHLPPRDPPHNLDAGNQIRYEVGISIGRFGPDALASRLSSVISVASSTSARATYVASHSLPVWRKLPGGPKQYWSPPPGDPIVPRDRGSVRPRGVADAPCVAVITATTASATTPIPRPARSCMPAPSCRSDLDRATDWILPARGDARNRWLTPHTTRLAPCPSTSSVPCSSRPSRRPGRAHGRGEGEFLGIRADEGEVGVGPGRPADRGHHALVEVGERQTRAAGSDHSVVGGA